MKHSSVVYDSYQPLPMDAETLAASSYIARKPCGCVVAMQALPENVKRGGKYSAEQAKSILEWLKDGYTIDRVPDQWIRGNGFKRCEAHKSAPQQRQMEL
jgi:hypothetical protein